MKHCHATRLVALAAAVALVLVFAAPAAAAPINGVGINVSWSPSALVQWAQSVWAGWFGEGGGVEQPSGIGNVFEKLDHQADPNGASATSTAPSDGRTTLSTGDTGISN